MDNAGLLRGEAAKVYSLSALVGVYSVDCHAFRGPIDHIDIRISHSRSKHQYKEDPRQHAW